jgi:hypothetical protein
MKYLLLPLILLLTGCPGPSVQPFGIQEQADFYKCAPVGGEDVLVACVPGTTLTGCEKIGSGMTDKNVVDCQ